MGSLPGGVPKSRGAGATPSLSSLRAGITGLYRRVDLAPAVGHNAFYIWGPGGCTGQIIISINVDPKAAAQAFGAVTLAGRTSCKACVDFENNAPILILRNPKEPFSVIWLQAKMYE